MKRVTVAFRACDGKPLACVMCDQVAKWVEERRTIVQPSSRVVFWIDPVYSVTESDMRGPKRKAKRKISETRRGKLLREIDKRIFENDDWAKDFNLRLQREQVKGRSKSNVRIWR